jgi:hypothetical protein
MVAAKKHVPIVKKHTKRFNRYDYTHTLFCDDDARERRCSDV